MTFTLRHLAASLLALAGATSAAAATEVRFINPEKFSDLREIRVLPSNYLAPIAAHIKALVDKDLPGMSLEVDITDVDLAGEIEPVGPRMEMIRVMRSVTWPRISLRYALKDASGKTVRTGEAQLSDMDYMNNLAGSSSEPLRYELNMLSNWFRREFVKTKP